MKELVEIVGNNIKRIRNERELTLDQLADITNVSKSMLHQIERGESNPTVVTLWKIASSLHIPFTSLVDKPMHPVSIVRRDEITPLSDDPERYELYSYFPFDPSKKFEILSIALPPGGTKYSEAHHPGVEEYVIVIKGVVEVSINKETHTITGGDAIHFVATYPHSFENKSKEPAELIVVDCYNA